MTMLAPAPSPSTVRFQGPPRHIEGTILMDGIVFGRPRATAAHDTYVSLELTWSGEIRSAFDWRTGDFWSAVER